MLSRRFFLIVAAMAAMGVVQGSVQGGILTAAMKNGSATINGAGLVATDIDASNGVIHVIDSVMLPPPATAKTSHVAPAKAQYVTYVCPTTGRVTYSVAQPTCRP